MSDQYRSIIVKDMSWRVRGFMHGYFTTWFKEKKKEFHLLTHQPLRVSNIKFLLPIPLLSQTLRSQKYRERSPSKEILDRWTNFLCQHHRKCIENGMENMHTDVRVKRPNQRRKLPSCVHTPNKLMIFLCFPIVFITFISDTKSINSWSVASSANHNKRSQNSYW